jgi:predicted AAA+ superfamily ATPase
MTFNELYTVLENDFMKGLDNLEGDLEILRDIKLAWREYLRIGYAPMSLQSFIEELRVHYSSLTMAFEDLVKVVGKSRAKYIIKYLQKNPGAFKGIDEAI